jgi:hypothetical protein
LKEFGGFDELLWFMRILGGEGERGVLGGVDANGDLYKSGIITLIS